MKPKHEPSFLYDVKSNANARKHLRKLKKDGHLITKEQRLECDKYAQKILGSLKYAPWLYVFTAVRGEFLEGWIPHNYHRRYIATRRKGVYGEVSAFGGLTYFLFDTDALPNVGYYFNGSFFSRDHILLKTQDAAEHLFKDCGEIVFKSDGSKQGNGIRFFTRDTFDPSVFSYISGGVFQKRLHHHAEFDRFGSKATATIRILTAIDLEGRCSARVLQLRLGGAGDTHIKGGTQVKTHADLRTGVLDERGFYQDFTITEVHRDSREKLGGFKIPRHSDAIELVVKLHEKYPFVQTIAWDVVVDRREKLHILEWNGGHSGIHFYEAAKGPLFKDLGWENEWKR